MKVMPVSKLLVVIFVMALLSILIVSALYFLNFHGSLSSEHAVWGTFGDFMGGVLNPTLSFLALIALLSTLYLQSEELKISRADAIESRKELSRSAEAQEKLGIHQSRQVKIQELSARVSVITLLLDYDGKTITEHTGYNGSSSSTIRIKEYNNLSKKQLLDELAEIYSALKTLNL
jgi:uncharacterized membrane protein